MPLFNSQHQNDRGIRWRGIAATAMVELLVLFALAFAVVRYVEWSSAVNLAEFMSATNPSSVANHSGEFSTRAQGPQGATRPYVELWAGVSDQLSHSAEFSALGEVSIPETYSPTVGMSNVTHANENILINLSAEASGVNLQFFSIEPATPLRVTLKRGGAVLFNDAVQADPKTGNRISATIPAGGSGEQVQLTIRTAEGKELIAAETKIK
jgi:hypothetical protein